MSTQHAAVIGLGTFGFAVAEELTKRGCDVICVDADIERVQAIKDLVVNAVQADATDEKALRAIGISEVDVAIISLGEEHGASILTAMILLDLGVKEIVAKVASELHARTLKRLGVSWVVIPEEDMGKRVAERLLAPHVLEHLELPDGYFIEEIVAPDEFLDKSISDLRFRSRFAGVSVLAIKRQGENRTEDIVVNPTRYDRIMPDDLLIVVGREKDLAKLRG
jgi:trk system potassium uptake protein TrkA